MSALAATFAVLLLAISAGPLGSAPAQARSSLLWATVNVCDTAAHPDTIGIRASMPGTAKGDETMFMRFRTQYLSGDDLTWHNVAGQGDSGFVEVGRANVAARQKGRYVQIQPTTASVILRGVVNFEWRRGGKVVRRAEKRTRKGRKSKAGDDPRGYTAASCKVTL